ncbi:hypothetical protein HRbin02_01830 [Candidatus Calditenuaceae archaeon HR02]|nr:hypothetical protein HRbin02_01830 [Candidatus Calditenuaceae archaeon HR02]
MGGFWVWSLFPLSRVAWVCWVFCVGVWVLGVRGCGLWGEKHVIDSIKRLRGEVLSPMAIRPYFHAAEGFSRFVWAA